MCAKFIKNYVLEGELEVITGLCIGGIKESIEIGGVDNIVQSTIDEKDPTKKIPFVPGSSVKGKIRSLLDLTYAEDISGSRKPSNEYIKIGDNTIKYPKNGRGALIPVVFGVPAEEGKHFSRSRLICRDFMPTEETKKWWDDNPNIVDGTEVKAENTVNRLTSAANPRFFERVPPRSKFKVELILSIYEGDDEKEMLSLLFEGLKMLEDSYLGGLGTRGSGKVKLVNLKMHERTIKYYEGSEKQREVDIDAFMEG